MTELFNNSSAQIPISVIIPVFNCQATLKESVESILRQTFTNFELIIINDGSTDDSRLIANQLRESDPRIIIIDQPNSGIVAALNNGLEHSRGTFIARMDGDDISHPTRFERQLNYLNLHPRLALLGTFYTEIPSGRSGRMPTGSKNVAFHLQNNGNAFVHSSVMMRASVVRKLGGYRNVFPHCEDYDLWIRIAEQNEVDNLPLFLLDYRRHIHSVSMKNLEQQFLSACGARRTAALRRNDFPDPALEAKDISLIQLADWGLRTDELCTKMIEWLEWNQRALESCDQTDKTTSQLEQLIHKYCLIRSEYRHTVMKNYPSSFSCIKDFG